MATAKCPLCGGKTENGICEQCGGNVKKDMSDMSAKRVQTVQNEAVMRKRQKEKRLIIILSGLIIIGMLGFAVLMILPFIISNISDPEVMEKAGISVESGNDEEQIKAFNEKGRWPSGMYKVGEEIPEGMYIMVVEGRSDELFPTSFYAEESVNGENDIIYDTWAENTRYITLTEPGYINVSWSVLYDCEKHSIENNPYEHSGMFLVGKDIEPGTYRLGFGKYSEAAEQSPHQSKYTIYSDVDAVAPIVKSQAECMESPMITLEEGDYLKLEKCVIIE